MKQILFQFEHIFDSLCMRVENIYSRLVSSLNAAANSVIPKHNINFYKYWWNEEGSCLKNAYLTHKAWIDARRPKTGPIYEDKRKAKYQYKCYLKQNQENGNNSVSNDLHDPLLNKNQNGFWRTWKAKFGNKTRNSSVVEGLSDEFKIASAFSEFFAKNNNVAFASKITEDSVTTRLSNYIGDSFHIHVSVEL